MFESFWRPTLTDLYWFSPELALVGTLVTLLIAPMIVGRSSRNATWIVVLGTLVTILLSWKVGGDVRSAGLSGLAPPEAAGMLILDNMSVYFKIVLMVFMLGVALLWSIGSAKKEKHAEEFLILLVGSALGMILMAGTLNLLMIIIAIELASLPSYAIVAFNKRNRRSAEASLKYVIFGGISSAIMLYGMSLLYGLYHTLDFARIAYGVVADLQAFAAVDVSSVAQSVDASMPAAQNTVAIGVALACFLAGIFFKIAAVPFHFWCPDVFEGAQIEVTTWLSVSSKSAAIVLLLRLVDTFSSATGAFPGGASLSALTGLAWGLGIVAAVTCTWGNFAAYRQNNVKRLFAYSSIAHAGYMMMAASVFVHPDSPLDYSPIAAVLVYILIYVFMNLGAFGVAAMVVWRSGNENIDAFHGLGRRAPWLAIPMLCCLVSLVGLPPFAGFIGKIWILLSLGASGGGLYWGLVIVAVLNTLVSLFFYLRIVKAMFFVDDGQESFTPPISGLAMVNVCAVVLVLMGTLFIEAPRRKAEFYASNLFRPAILKGGMSHAENAAIDATQGELLRLTEGVARIEGERNRRSDRQAQTP